MLTRMVAWFFEQTVYPGLPMVETNSTSRWGLGYDYVFPAKVQINLAPLVEGFPVLVVNGRQVL